MSKKEILSKRNFVVYPLIKNNFYYPNKIFHIFVAGTQILNDKYIIDYVY
jgi:hypothetical protein